MGQNNQNGQKMVIYRRIKGRVVPIKVKKGQMAWGAGASTLSAGAGTSLAYAAGRRAKRSRARFRAGSLLRGYSEYTGGKAGRNAAREASKNFMGGRIDRLASKRMLGAAAVGTTAGIAGSMYLIRKSLGEKPTEAQVFQDTSVAAGTAFAMTATAFLAGSGRPGRTLGMLAKKGYKVGNKAIKRWSVKIKRTKR